MKFLRQIFDGCSRWLDGVAQAIVAMIGWFVVRRAVELIEDESGAFTVRASGKAASQAGPVAHLQIKEGGGTRIPSDQGVPNLKGSRVDIVLRPSRFMFRQLELPQRASEFLDGIIRSQIDRLTPWSIEDAVFGWSKPNAIGNDRIVVTVAATSRTQLTPFVQAVTGLGADSIVVSTIPEDSEHGTAPISIFQQQTRSAVDIHRVRGVLIAILMITSLAATMSIGAAVVIADDLSTRQDDLARRIGDRRAALRAGLDAAANSALARLERRKYEDPAVVIVLDELTKVLPDHTFVTELRFEGKTMQVIGVTRDAPSLIGLIEQSPHFARATFFAPTTRSPSDPGERFHIEVRIEPSNTPRT
jgi:general secretion pathway protein L